MKIVLQRVSQAKVSVDDVITGSIGRGYVILLGFGAEDSGMDINKINKTIEKIQKLRIFPDENGKINLSVNDVNGGILVVSQFTLYADCKKGNRPSFTEAADPKTAENLYNIFLQCAEDKFAAVKSGIFGAAMRVELVNEGPFTVIIEA
ncbi:MAG: D-aminoacyl-tRNA deacylase [Oscillospiraceae bacterium]|nr:D-aminoacyl-tRNA deacylase [Oscillospiraceae bacterium]